MGHPLWCGQCQRGLFTVTPPHQAGGVNGYNHHDIGEEVEWRPLLSYANPLGHCATTALFIARFMRNDISGHHYEMTNKVA